MKHLWLGLLTALALIACPSTTQSAPPTSPPTQPPTSPPPATTGAISGVVSAPSGVDIKDTVVVACYLVGADGCDSAKTAGVTIAQSGSSATYTIPNLVTGDYVVLALKVTLDSSNEIKTIDYLGGYGTDDTRVKPPATKIDIALKATASTAPTAPPSSSPAPAGKVSADVVGSWNGRASGTDIYAISSDGTYSRNVRNSYRCYLTQRVEAGNAVTSGDQITFYPTSNVTRTTTCGTVEEDRTLPPVTSFTYRFETDPINANRYLFLKPASGTELQYLKE